MDISTTNGLIILFCIVICFLWYLTSINKDLICEECENFDDHFMSDNKIPNQFNNTSRRSNSSDDGEGFLWDPLWKGKRALDCYNLNKRDCMKYSNCGLCLKDGKSKCVPGDEQGPLFEENCEHWVHTNYYDRHIFDEKVTRISRPFDYHYPEYEVMYPSPTSRSAL